MYKVVNYWPQRGQAGFIVWRYRLRRDDPAPPPWSQEGRRRIEQGGWGHLRKPENYDEAQAEKLKAKAAKLDEGEEGKVNNKRGAKRKISESGSEVSAKKIPVAKFKIPSNYLKAMDRDEKNKRLWDEVRCREYVTKKDLVDHVEGQVQCDFCLCIVTAPVTMPCSHSFCQSCLERAFQAKHFSCSTCRADLKDVKVEVNQEMRECLLLIFPGYDI